jgi:hypothetical protein
VEGVSPTNRPSVPWLSPWSSTQIFLNQGLTLTPTNPRQNHEGALAFRYAGADESFIAFLPIHLSPSGWQI